MDKGKLDKRGIRWNWNETRDLNLHNNKIYSFYLNLTYDHTPEFRAEKLNEALKEASTIGEWNFYFEPSRPDLSGNVEGTKLKYLCKVYESNCPPKYLEKILKKKFHRVHRDPYLYERSGKNTKINLEEYLRRVHSK